MLLQPDLLRDRARRCRDLLNHAIAPEVVEQLEVWSCEFEAKADKLDAELAGARRALHQSVM